MAERQQKRQMRANEQHVIECERLKEVRSWLDSILELMDEQAAGEAERGRRRHSSPSGLPSAACALDWVGILTAQFMCRLEKRTSEPKATTLFCT